MALSIHFVERHIEHWTEKLNSQFRLYRKHWPSCLFHHAPLENAVSILQDGYIRSRNDPNRKISRDVAAPGVIDNTNDAHDRVRLYFRPKTPTQYHIEGIRKAADCAYGIDVHAPILVMFVLDAKAVLTTPNLIFSDRNMQRSDRKLGSDEGFFATIPFEKVYHEGNFGGDNSIAAHRCAEVLPNSPLNLPDFLTGIWFRSEPERDTLLHQLGSARSRWERLCRVSEELKVFDKNYAFLNDLSLSEQGVRFRINNRHDLKNVNLAIKVYRKPNDLVIDFYSPDFPTTNSFRGFWMIRNALEPSDYFLRVTIEDHLAYEGIISIQDSLI